MSEDRIHIEGLQGQGEPLSIQGKGYITYRGGVYFNLLCHLTEEYYQTLKPIVKDGIQKDDEERRFFNAEIVGNLKKQKIKLDKVIGQVIKTNLRKIGRGFKKLFN